MIMTLRFRLILAFLLVALTPLALLAWSVGPILDRVKSGRLAELAESKRPLLSLQDQERVLHNRLVAAGEELSVAVTNGNVDLSDLLAEPSGYFARRRKEKSEKFLRELADSNSLERLLIRRDSQTLFALPPKNPPAFPSHPEQTHGWRWLPDSGLFSLSTCAPLATDPVPDGQLWLIAEKRFQPETLNHSLAQRAGLPIDVAGRLPGQAEPEPAGAHQILAQIHSRSGRVVGVIRADLSDALAPWSARLREKLLLSVVVGSGLALILALLLGSLLARPLQRLTRAVSTVADHPGDPATMPGGGGEIGALAGAVDRMLAALRREQKHRTRAERTAAWQEVARRVAHEVRNPLTPIRLGVGNLLRARRKGLDRLEGCLEEEASAILEEVARLEKLVNEFSQFARLPHVQPRAVDLPALIRRAVSGQTEGLDRVHVIFDLADPRKSLRESSRENSREGSDDGSGGGFSADPTLLAMALANLARNAVQAMGNEGGELRVISGPCADEPERAFFEVRLEDSGPGLEEEMLEHLFEPYVTGRGPEGTGLGLAIVRQVIAEHGGRVEAGNLGRGGAVFRILLPIEPNP